ncbi:neuromedin U [Pontiella sulfatireligans]|nr:neuromedin U [Pontiella sulfatireligans]
MRKQTQQYKLSARPLLLIALLGGFSAFAHDAATHTNAPPAGAQNTSSAAHANPAGKPAAAHDAAELAKKTQNPVANMISLPVQFNFNQNVGPKSDSQTIINVQPVIPQELNEDWNWIHRTIVPIIDQPAPVNDSGIGNILYEGFLTPANPKNGLIWGVGPVLSFPTVTADLGNKKWSAGPAGLLMKMEGPWVYGALAYNMWSYGGTGENQNNMLINYFCNYNFKEFYLSTAPNVTADWEADSDQQWTVPVGLTIGKVFKPKSGPPVNIKIGGYYNVVHPDQGAEWQLQCQVQFLFLK